MNNLLSLVAALLLLGGCSIAPLAGSDGNSALLTGTSAATSDQLRDHQQVARALFVESAYHGCMKALERSATAPQPERSSEFQARVCNCSAVNFIKYYDAEIARSPTLKNEGLIDQMSQRLSNSAQQVGQQVADWCKQNYTGYTPAPPNWNSHKARNTNGSVLFNGQAHRFTAFIQEIYDADRQLLRAGRVEPGKILLDLTIQSDLTGASLSNAKDGQRSRLTTLPSPSPKAMEFGYDFSYFVPDSQGELLINSRRNVMMVIQRNNKENRIYQTYLVRTTDLLCKALTDAKDRAIASTAKSIFKEIIIAALRSYAGASYSRGNFTARTSTGSDISGTYTLYDNSWLGEHYSRGLDAIFQGTATVSQINTEIAKNECDDK